MALVPFQTPNMQSYLASEDLSAKQYTFVKFSSSVARGVVAVSGTGDVPVGILMNAPASGESADVAMLGGGAKLKVGGVVAPGGRVKTTAAGLGVAATADGEWVCAHVDAFGANSASGDIVPVMLHSYSLRVPI